MKYKKGDIVMVYQDPLTQTKIDGKAVLLKHEPLQYETDTEQWLVRFLDGMETYRLIKRPSND